MALLDIARLGGCFLFQLRFGPASIHISEPALRIIGEKA